MPCWGGAYPPIMSLWGTRDTRDSPSYKRFLFPVGPCTTICPCLPSICADSLQIVLCRTWFAVGSTICSHPPSHCETRRSTEDRIWRGKSCEPQSAPLVRSSAVSRACTGNGVPAVGRRFGAEFSDWRWAGDEGRSLGVNRGRTRI